MSEKLIWQGVSERYEYKCPYCGHVNVRYERTGRIVCNACGRGFG